MHFKEQKCEMSLESVVQLVFDILILFLNKIAVCIFEVSCPNAFWNGFAVNACTSIARTDVIAHEWTHAYTQTTHRLIYQGLLENMIRALTINRSKWCIKRSLFRHLGRICTNFVWNSEATCKKIHHAMH